MSKRGRAWRRAQEVRKKKKVKKHWSLQPILFGDGNSSWVPSPRDVGRVAATPAACSCWMCRNDWGDERHAHRRQKQAIIKEQLES